jgi:hypothetical protein
MHFLSIYDILFKLEFNYDTDTKILKIEVSVFIWFFPTPQQINIQQII